VLRDNGKQVIVETRRPSRSKRQFRLDIADLSREVPVERRRFVPVGDRTVKEHWKFLLSRQHAEAATKTSPDLKKEAEAIKRHIIEALRIADAVSKSGGQLPGRVRILEKLRQLDGILGQ
jgi:hypothetical protein